jgi:hypothetical protein
MPHFKSIAGLRIGVGYIDTADYCRGRPIAKPRNQPIDRSFFASQMRFHASVRAVAHPAPNAELIGLLLRPGAEEDPLNPTGHEDMAANARHHTTLMSGASSAFMPTTL